MVFIYLLTYFGVLEVELGVVCMLSMGFLTKLHLQFPKCKTLITKATWWKCRAFFTIEISPFLCGLDFFENETSQKNLFHHIWYPKHRKPQVQDLPDVCNLITPKNDNVVGKVYAGKLGN